MRYTSMRCTPTNEMHAHEVHAREMHAYEVHAHKVNAHEVHTAMQLSKQTNVLY
jgi:hypothetical protein